QAPPLAGVAVAVSETAATRTYMGRAVNHCPPRARLSTSAQGEDPVVEYRLSAAVHASPVRALTGARLPDVEDQHITGRDHPGKARADLADEFGAPVGGDVRQRFGDDSVGRQTVENRTGKAGGARELRVDVQGGQVTIEAVEQSLIRARDDAHAGIGSALWKRLRRGCRLAAESALPAHIDLRVLGPQRPVGVGGRRLEDDERRLAEVMHVSDEASENGRARGRQGPVGGER